MQQQGLWLPATFSECQEQPWGTWQHTNGAWKRGDYVGLLVQWRYDKCQAFVAQDIDVSTLKDDNKGAIVRFEGPSPTCKPCRQSRNCALQDVAVATVDPGAFTAITTPDFTVDVHTHAHLLEQQLLQQFAKRSVKRPRMPRKESMSPDTWQLVLTKRDWRKHLWEAQALQKHTLLQTCFQAWHDPKDEGHSHWLPLRALIRQQDAMIAQAMSSVQWLGRQVVKALRHDNVTTLPSSTSLLRKLAPSYNRNKRRIFGGALSAEIPTEACASTT